MPQEGNSILVVFLDRQLEGLEFERHRAQWPLHVTLVSWFDSGGGAAFDRSLTQAAQSLKAFSVVLGKQELFGRTHDIPVNVISDQVQIAAIHARLSEIVAASAKTMLVSPWVGDAYQAHVTRHGNGDDRQAGDGITIDSFYLVRLLPDNICRVVKCYTFGDAYETTA